MSTLVHDTGDISVHTIGAIDLLALFEDVTYTVNETQVDGSIIARRAGRAEGQKLEAKIETKLMSTKGSGDRVGHLDLSAAAIGGTAYLGLVRSLKLSGSFVQKARAGVGSAWKRPQNTSKDYQASVEIDCDDDIASALMALMHSLTFTDRDVVLSFTLNGIAVTIPMRIESIAHKGSRADLQIMTLTLTGKDPGTGAYPTAPTTSTTLLGKALNAFRTALAFTYTSKSADGFSVTGNVIFDSFSVEINDEQLEYESYSFMSYGTVTASAT